MTVNVSTFDKLKEVLKVAEEMGERNPYITMNVYLDMSETKKE